MKGSGVIPGGVSLVDGGRQGRHNRVPVRVPVYRIRWRRRGRTVPNRRRWRFIIVTITGLVPVVLVVLIVLMVQRMVITVVGRTTGHRPVTGAGRHDVHRGRRQRRRHPAVRAVNRAQRTRPMLGRRALPCRGCGGGGSAPRLVVNVLVELHGCGARSTD